jgi:uncharacterized protein YyaL (SSP411 family)
MSPAVYNQALTYFFFASPVSWRHVTAFFFIGLALTCCKPGGTGTANKSNRLASASSPYLKQHADNPVNWYEWGPEALKKAREENKPLIISIGYSSCHWCHVMERESFMDTAVARIMNESFVSIKIDREERPDIDQIYMNAAQVLSGSGGWPLNAFALSDGKPFYAATYFPKEQWINLLQQVKTAFTDNPTAVANQAASLTQAIQSSPAITNEKKRLVADENAYRGIFLSWQSSIDLSEGGLVGAPKFPLPTVWEFLLQYHYFTGDKKAFQAVTNSLNAIEKRGLHDHLGGGFARYTTDNHWKIPHFEKMLYDNGQLVSLYAHAYQATQDPVYRDVVRKTLQFVRREMTSPEGGFYSSINADSEGEEGKFYVWKKNEIDAALDSSHSALFTKFYNVTDTGNWEDGKNVLYKDLSLQDLAKDQNMSLEECARQLGDAEKTMLNTRQKRVRPSTDTKILAGWNALMLKGYVDAFFAFGEQPYLEAALVNAHFLKKNMMRGGGKLYRSYNDGSPSIEAFLDDYALLAKAYIYLYQATFDVQWLEQAKSLVDFSIQHFRDGESGFFYYTSGQAENLVARNMELTDQVIPSSNSVLAECLHLLGIYFQHDTYTTMSHQIVMQMEENMSASPSYTHWASVLGLIRHATREVAVMGDEALTKTARLRRHYIPNAVYMGGNHENIPLLKNKLVKGRTIIYVCENRVCKLPVEDAEVAVKQLFDGRILSP